MEETADVFYEQIEMEITLDGKDKKCLLVNIPIDDLEKFIVKNETFTLVSADDEDVYFPITPLDMQNYLHFFASRGLEEMDSIPFLIDLDMQIVINPVYGNDNVLWSGFKESFSLHNVDLKDEDGKYKPFSVMEIPLNLVNILIKEEQDLIDEKKVVIDHKFLSVIYSDFKLKNKKTDEKILNLAFDNDDLVGYVLEASLDGNASETKLCRVKQNTWFIRCFYFFYFVSLFVVSFSLSIKFDSNFSLSQIHKSFIIQ